MAWLSGTTLWDGAGWTLLLTGLLLAAWALFWDRPGGRLRCPRCWYRVEGVPISLLKFHRTQREAMKCPECGEVITDERMLRRTRRRWWLLLPALLLIMLSPQAWDQPGRIQDTETWSRAVPTWITACALQWNDTSVRADVKMLLSVRRPRCNALERAWMDLWRERTMHLDARDQLSYRATVVAGMPFIVKEDPSPTWRTSRFGTNPPIAARSRVFAMPIPISSELESRSYRLLDTLKSGDALSDDVVIGPGWPNERRLRVVAPLKPGHHTILIPMQENDDAGPLRVDAPIDIEVVEDVNAVLSPQLEEAFQEQLRKWIRLNLTTEKAKVWYVGTERSANYALSCELVKSGTVIAKSNWPLLPLGERMTTITLDYEFRRELRAIRDNPALPADWTLRLRGAPEVTHEFTHDSTYWKGEVEIPIRDVLK